MLASYLLLLAKLDALYWWHILVGKLRNYLKNSFVPIVQLLQKVKNATTADIIKRTKQVDVAVFDHQ